MEAMVVRTTEELNGGWRNFLLEGVSPTVIRRFKMMRMM